MTPGNFPARPHTRTVILGRFADLNYILLLLPLLLYYYYYTYYFYYTYNYYTFPPLRNLFKFWICGKPITIFTESFHPFPLV
jgi:hypothetical protein